MGCVGVGGGRGKGERMSETGKLEGEEDWVYLSVFSLVSRKHVN